MAADHLSERVDLDERHDPAAVIEDYNVALDARLSSILCRRGHVAAAIAEGLCPADLGRLFQKLDAPRS
jgi:hypothetical protein